MWGWYQKSPATNLARRDLIKQAEVLERVINVMKQPMTDGGLPWLVRVEDIQAMADDLRQQTTWRKTNETHRNDYSTPGRADFLFPGAVLNHPAAYLDCEVITHN